ncbi:MAG: DUF5684 domain-containing protein [Cytophaga sp.]|uniref:DUF5684 domain-containing protein n=1 Tax=Cytophaga sp. TaxID=29535 RepID=UPI003F812D46
MDSTQVVDYSASSDTIITTTSAGLSQQDADLMATMIQAMGAAFIGILIFFIAMMIFMIVCNWIIFEKAGRKGWESIVPYYNIYVLFQFIGRSLWNILWIFLPIVGIIVFLIKMNVSLAKSFGKGTGFALGLIFLSPIFHAILAFDKSIVYVGPNGVPTDQGSGALDSDI